MYTNLFRFDLLRVIHFDLHFAVNSSPALHSYAGNVSCRSESIRRLSVNVSYDRFHILFEFFQLPAQSVSDHANGFCETNVASHGAVCFSCVEFINGDADALFFHYSRTKRG